MTKFGLKEGRERGGLAQKEVMFFRAGVDVLLLQLFLGRGDCLNRGGVSTGSWNLQTNYMSCGDPEFLCKIFLDTSKRWEKEKRKIRIIYVCITIYRIDPLISLPIKSII